MRVRTDAKRLEIVEVAAQLFLERGYQGTSMSLVSEQLGGSKGTLYGYFKSKEDLLLAVMEEEVARATDETLAEGLDEELRESLRQLGLRYLRARLRLRHVRLFRIMASLPEGSALGGKFHEQAIVPANRQTTERMAKLIEQGELRAADPETMTAHFKGMLDRDLTERSILSPRDEISREEIEQSATEAVDAFLRAYSAGPEVERG